VRKDRHRASFIACFLGMVEGLGGVWLTGVLDHSCVRHVCVCVCGGGGGGDGGEGGRYVSSNCWKVVGYRVCASICVLACVRVCVCACVRVCLCV